MSMANISIVGNLVKSPEQICFPSGSTKATFVVAVNNLSKSSNKNEGESTCYFKVETWGKLAELATKYLQKGNQVGISGRFMMENWTDRQGKERSTPVVSAQQLSLPSRQGIKDKTTKLDINAVNIDQSQDNSLELSDQDDPKNEQAGVVQDNFLDNKQLLSVHELAAHYCVQTKSSC